jgi:hypothetical protein
MGRDGIEQILAPTQVADGVACCGSRGVVIITIDLIGTPCNGTRVTDACYNLISPRRGINRTRPAVTQTEENHRLVRARTKVGDATTAEITDAESTLTRAASQER